MSASNTSSHSLAREARLPVSRRVARMELVDHGSKNVAEVHNVSRQGMCLSGVGAAEVGATLHVVGTGILRGASATTTVAWRDADRVGLRVDHFANKKSEGVWLSTLLELQDAHFHDVVRRMEKRSEMRDEFFSLVEAGERLREEKLRRQFAAAMSFAVHDLANPVSSAYSTIQLLTGGIIDVDQFMQEGLAGVVERNCRRALLEIEQLLSMAGASDLLASLTLFDCDMRDLLHNVAESQAARAAVKGIALTWTCPEGLSVPADHGKILRVVENLVTNALKYTWRGGTVSLSGAPVEGGVILEVRDTGIGLTPDQAAKIFEPLEKDGPGPTDGELSHGLGLAASRAIVQAHGGRITVSSEEGQGSVFTVHLPARR